MFLYYSLCIVKMIFSYLHFLNNNNSNNNNIDVYYIRHIHLKTMCQKNMLRAVIKLYYIMKTFSQTQKRKFHNIFLQKLKPEKIWLQEIYREKVGGHL